MRQLTSLDAQFLALETSRQTGHVGGLAILDPSDMPGGELRLEGVQELLTERLPLLPPFRWRLAEVPFGLDYPYWIDDPDFDLDFHVRELALPSPGTDAKLAEQVARIMARPLDRARPLWELYLIHGLEDGNVGMLTKVHHALIDGMSGAEIMGVLYDLEPEGRAVPEERLPPREAEPGQLEMLGRGLMGLPRYPLRALRSLPARCRTSTRRRSRPSRAPSASRRWRAVSSGRSPAATAPASAARTCALPTPRSTAASPRIAASPSGACRSTTSRRSRTSTTAPSTTSSSRSAPGRCATG